MDWRIHNSSAEHSGFLNIRNIPALLRKLIQQCCSENSFTFNKRHNARHQPPRTQPDYCQVARMKSTLLAVGCTALLGAAEPPGS